MKYQSNIRLAGMLASKMLTRSCLEVARKTSNFFLASTTAICISEKMKLKQWKINPSLFVLPLSNKNMKTREITLTGNGRWVKIVRDDSKCFSFYIGWKVNLSPIKAMFGVVLLRLGKMLGN